MSYEMNEIDIKVQGAKRLIRLEVHQEVINKANSLNKVMK
jgi:hypothetical protein